jgi:carbonyl reductase 1
MIVLITGATRGLGREIVRALVGGNHTIYLGCRDVDAGEALAAELAAAECGDGSSTIVPLQLDVQNPAMVSIAAAKLTDDGVLLDALVNNAGVLLERDDASLGSIVEPTLAVNLDGVVTVTTCFLPLMRADGQIINVSSGAGTRATGQMSDAAREELEAADSGLQLRVVATRLAWEAARKPRQSGETPVYGISKAALNFYTQLVARQAVHLRVNACSPGFCRTEIAGPNADYSAREPKDPALGADVVVKLLLTDLGAGCTGRFYKECSKPGTPLEAARSCKEPWVA